MLRSASKSCVSALVLVYDCRCNVTLIQIRQSNVACATLVMVNIHGFYWIVIVLVLVVWVPLRVLFYRTIVFAVLIDVCL